MALKPCKNCGRELSVTADKCPNCATKNPTMTASDWLKGWVAVVALLFVGYLFLGGGDDGSESVAGSESASTEPSIQVDDSEEMQNKRERLMDEAIEMGALHDIKVTDNGVNVYVTDMFMNGAFENKESIASMIAAWHYVKTGDTQVFLYDYRSNNIVGSYNANYGGLSMND